MITGRGETPVISPFSYLSQHYMMTHRTSLLPRQGAVVVKLGGVCVAVCAGGVDRGSRLADRDDVTGEKAELKIDTKTSKNQET